MRTSEFLFGSSPCKPFYCYYPSEYLFYSNFLFWERSNERFDYSFFKDLSLKDLLTLTGGIECSIEAK